MAMCHPIPKPRTWLSPCSPIHIHSLLRPLQPAPQGSPLKKSSSPSEQEPPRGVLTGRPTSPGRPGSPDSPGSPCRGEKRMNTLTFPQVAELAACVAKPLHECCSKRLQASIRLVWTALPSLLLLQDFLFPREDPVDHLLLVVQMDLWVQVGLAGPERKRRQV